jgi:hypothetical protein
MTINHKHKPRFIALLHPTGPTEAAVVAAAAISQGLNCQAFY